MLKVCGSPRIWILLIAAIASHRICRVRLFIRELTNRRLLHDAAVRLRDILSAHAFLSTCQRRAKGDDVAFSSPRGRAPFGQHQESRPLASSNDILVLNGFVNTID